MQRARSRTVVLGAAWAAPVVAVAAAAQDHGFPGGSIRRAVIAGLPI